MRAVSTLHDGEEADCLVVVSGVAHLVSNGVASGRCCCGPVSGTPQQGAPPHLGAAEEEGRQGADRALATGTNGPANARNNGPPSASTIPGVRSKTQI